jgi:Cu-Zn family superoxide dismutase
VLLVACQQQQTTEQTEAPAPEPTALPLQVAVADIGPASGSELGGRATFTRTDGGVQLDLELENASPGVHAVHLHEFGDCSADDASSAGGHWNPTGEDHGKWGEPPFHLGDIGNVEVGDDGTGSLTMTTDLWSLGDGSDTDVVGKSVVVHAGADDFTSQPSGAAGDRIGCGVVEAQPPLMGS